MRFKDNSGPREEMFFATEVLAQTQKLNNFNEVAMYFQKNNTQLKNIIPCVTDAAPSMKGRYKGFIAHLKKDVPEVFCIHCATLSTLSCKEAERTSD